MGASLIWGKGFKLEEDATVPGQSCLQVVGIGGSHDMISWTSVVELETLAEQYGVSKEIWPIYRGYEVESKIPLDDAVRRSSELRTALQKLDPQAIEGDYWLRFIWKLLCEGHSFLIVP